MRAPRIVSPVAVALISVAWASPLAAQDPFQGPNLLLTRDRVRALQAARAANDPLVVAAWDEAVRAADRALGHTPDPIRGRLKIPGFYTKGKATQQAITRRLRGDGYAAAALAYGFALTGRADYADRAEAIVFAWVDNLGPPQDGGAWYLRFVGEHRGDTPIVTYYSFPLFLQAYDVLAGAGRIDAGERARFEAWLRPYVAYLQREERYKNNHHAWQCAFLLAAGHCLRDRALIDRAAGYLRNGLRHYVARDGSLWRELVRKEKAATYTVMALEGAMLAVTFAERHGHAGLRLQRADRRGLGSTIALRALAFRPFGGLPVPKDGGTLRDAIGLLRDFVHDPRSWDRFEPLTRTRALNGPAAPTDWGWLFEHAHAWWGDARDLALAGAAPYGLQPPRAYATPHATLCLRPLTPPPTPGISTTVPTPGGP